jgi:hypothetical protein
VGFQEVQVEALPLIFHFPSFEMLTAWWGSPFEKALAKLEPEPRRRTLEEVRKTVRPFEGPQGIMAPAEVLLGVAIKERLSGSASLYNYRLVAHPAG